MGAHQGWEKLVGSKGGCARDAWTVETAAKLSTPCSGRVCAVVERFGQSSRDGEPLVLCPSMARPLASRQSWQCVSTLTPNGHGGGGVWREERRRVRGEEEASALRRPFGCPSRGPSGALVWCSSGAFQVLLSVLGGLSGAVLWGGAPHHDHERGRGRLTTCESRHSSVLSNLFRVHSVRAHFTLKDRILAQNNPK